MSQSHPFLLPDGRRFLVYDIEVFPNATLVCVDGLGKPWAVWVREREDNTRSMTFLSKVFGNGDHVMGGYNNHGYDDVIMREFLRGATPQDLHQLSFKIIQGAEAGDQTVWRLQYSDTPWAYSLDIFQMLNGKGSLKEWECREGMVNIAESPVDFMKPLDSANAQKVVDYCLNDVKATSFLFQKYWHLVTLRHKLQGLFNLSDRVYCMSEQKMAEHTFVELHGERTTQRVGKIRAAAKANPENSAGVFNLQDIIFPKVRFSSPPFTDLLADLKASQVTSPNTVTWSLPDKYKKPIQLGGKMYQLGVGGLHSEDDPGIYEATEDTAIVDLDVASYYPSIMVNHELHPRHIGKGFVKDMTKLRDLRLKAKRDGDKGTNEALKIVINSVFGKLNDVYSPIRSVPDALRVTINGQLMLLMLIEMLEECGAQILSSNTDGVTIRWDVMDVELMLPQIIDRWQKVTGFELEVKRFKRYCRRDVNNYIAVYEDGKVKTKGAFNQTSPYPQPDRINYNGLAVKQAVEAYFIHNIDPLDFVRNISDIKPFLYYQRAGNGGHMYYGDKLVGKCVRWYCANKGPQVRRKNPPRNKAQWACIPNGENALLAMNLDEIPSTYDINYGRYAEQAWEIITSCGSAT